MGLMIKYSDDFYDEYTHRIELSKGMFCLVDKEDFHQLKKYRWKAKMSHTCWYAVRREKTATGIVEIKMHRQIMNTPKGWDCHHGNANTLDNRRINLKNLTKQNHQVEHKTRTFCKLKFKLSELPF